MNYHKVCIFGYGKWSRKFIPNLNNKQYKIEKIITNKDFNDKTFVKKISKKKLSEFDIIYLAKDPERNYKFFINNFHYMKNVVFEKPSSLSIKKINNIINICESNKLKLIVSYPQIYSKIFDFISINNIKKISIVNCGNGPVRDYLNPVDDYIPFVLILIIKLIDISNINLSKLKKKINKNKINKNKYNFKSSFILNDIIFDIHVGNNFKTRQSYIKLYKKDGIIEKFNFIKETIHERSKLLRIYKNNDNISNMLDYLLKSNFNVIFNMLLKEKVAYKLSRDLN